MESPRVNDKSSFLVILFNGFEEYFFLLLKLFMNIPDPSTAI